MDLIKTQMGEAGGEERQGDSGIEEEEQGGR
jgi:hypothetical protein